MAGEASPFARAEMSDGPEVAVLGACVGSLVATAPMALIGGEGLNFEQLTRAGAQLVATREDGLVMGLDAEALPGTAGWRAVSMRVPYQWHDCGGLEPGEDTGEIVAITTAEGKVLAESRLRKPGAGGEAHAGGLPPAASSTGGLSWARVQRGESTQWLGLVFEESGTALELSVFSPQEGAVEVVRITVATWGC